MSRLLQSTARSKVVFMTDSTDHVTGKTGLTLTITASKDGGSFASITPTVTELATGWYKLALTSSHTDTVGDLALHITATGADPTDVVWEVESKDLFSNLTGDAYARLGAPAGASVSADIAAVKAQTAAIEVDTQDIQSRLPAALISGRIDASVGAMAANVITAAAIAADAITDAKVAADVTIASVTGAVGSVTAGVSVAVGGIASTSFAAGAIDAAAIAADAIGSSELATSAGQEIADRVLARNIAGGSDGGRDVTSALRSLRNRAAIAAGTLTVYQEDDTTPAWTAAVTTTAGDPLSEVDPA